MRKVVQNCMGDTDLPTKKEIAVKINKILGVDWNWNKALTKDKLTELLKILSDYGKLALSSSKELIKDQVDGRVKGLVSDVVDSVDVEDLPIGDKKHRIGDGHLLRKVVKKIVKKRFFGDDED